MSEGMGGHPDSICSLELLTWDGGSELPPWLLPQKEPMKGKTWVARVTLHTEPHSARQALLHPN